MSDNKLNMAIVGLGFVGNAVSEGFRSCMVNQTIIDPKIGVTIESLKDKKFDVIFVCVPTPMTDDGSIDSSIVESVIEYLEANTEGLIVLKSTVTPDVIEKFEHMSDRFIYNPEFLTEARAVHDFLNPEFHVFGGEYKICDQLQAIYEQYSRCSKCDTYIVTPKEASFIKYGINNFLALKVAWFNQFSELIEKHDCSYTAVSNTMKADPRIGTSHMQVPGPDGRRGYGGACFTKDTAALLRFSNNEMTITRESIRYNNQVRSQYKLDEREKEQKVTLNIEL